MQGGVAFDSHFSEHIVMHVNISTIQGGNDYCQLWYIEGGIMCNSCKQHPSHMEMGLTLVGSTSCERDVACYYHTK